MPINIISMLKGLMLPEEELERLVHGSPPHGLDCGRRNDLVLQLEVERRERDERLRPAGFRGRADKPEERSKPPKGPGTPGCPLFHLKLAETVLVRVLPEHHGEELLKIALDLGLLLAFERSVHGTRKPCLG